MTLQLGLLLAYCVLQVGVGLWIGRRVKTTADFFVAGRSLGPGLLFATMLAANIGAGSTVGAAGLGYRDGLAAWWWVGSAAIGSWFLALTVGPRMRRVAEERGLHTVGDFLEDRYGRTVRGVLALLLWMGTLAILAGQLIALAWVLNVVAGIPKWAGCLLGGLVATAYFTAGGLLTSVFVNALQLVVMFAGFAIGLPLVIAHAGGLSALVAATSSQPDFWSLWQGGPSGVVYLALLGPAFVVSPGLLQKVYGAQGRPRGAPGRGGQRSRLVCICVRAPALWHRRSRAASWSRATRAGPPQRADARPAPVARRPRPRGRGLG